MGTVRTGKRRAMMAHQYGPLVFATAVVLAVVTRDWLAQRRNARPGK